MYIVMVASECAPVAKVGGLADVVFGLSRELELRGNSVEIVLPKYQCMRYDQIFGLCVAYEDLWVPWFETRVHCTVYFGFVHGRKCFFIEPHSGENFFGRGALYGFDDEAHRFTFFSKAAAEFLFASGKRPDIIHTHDWQAALVPVLLFEIYKFHGMENVRACHTIHNFRHQGVVGQDVLRATGLGRAGYYAARDRLEDDSHRGALNLTKGAIVYSNFVTTVSPKHAHEARHSAEGSGLGRVLDAQQQKFGGVLNGLDYDTWNPATDGSIARRYSAEHVTAKYENKAALRDRLWLRDGYKPLVAYVGRLDGQKGVHLIRHALFHSLRHGAQFVLLGSSPDPRIQADFEQLKRQLNDSPDCHIELRFDEDLARQIYAGADMIIVPSLYEPCGLTQLIALRYGTVPVVRSVGGLADTVFDRDHAWQHPDDRNGYSFEHADERGIESALHRAIGLWNDHPSEFRKLMSTGMRQDFSWNLPGKDYVNIYEYIRHR